MADSTNDQATGGAEPSGVDQERVSQIVATLRAATTRPAPRTPPPPPPPPPPAVPVPPPPPPEPALAGRPLAGRLFRGPARRTAVFDREIWHPVSTRSPRAPHEVGAALAAAVERYRKGSLSTSGLVRAIGRADAA